MNVVSGAIRDVGFAVVTPISNFRDKRDLPVYFCWVFVLGAMWDF